MNANGSLRYKTRLVIKGYEKRADVDYQEEELYAPVAKFVSIRALPLTAVLDWEILQLDKTAFLYPEINEEIYMELLEGYNADVESKVCRLKKSMYGLKQAPGTLQLINI